MRDALSATAFPDLPQKGFASSFTRICLPMPFPSWTDRAKEGLKNGKTSDILLGILPSSGKEHAARPLSSGCTKAIADKATVD